MQSFFGVSFSEPTIRDGWFSPRPVSTGRLSATQAALCLAIIGSMVTMAGSILPLPIIRELVFATGVLMVVTGMGILLIKSMAAEPVSYQYGFNWGPSWMNPWHQPRHTHHYYNHFWPPMQSHGTARRSEDYSWHRSNREAPRNLNWGHREPMPTSRKGTGFGGTSRR